jgi:hypothetical protein
MSAASVLIQMWRGSLVRTSRAPDIAPSQLWRGSLVRTSRAPDFAPSRRIKLLEFFLLRIDFQRMSAASVLIQLWRGSLVRSSQAPDIAPSKLWRGSLVRTSRAPDFAPSRRIKLPEFFLLRIDFERMSPASVLIQLWRGSLVRSSRAPDIASTRRSSYFGSSEVVSYEHL